MSNIGCYRDKTYCASPNCKNECGRKISDELRKLLAQDEHSRASYAYFCGEPSQELLDTLSRIYLKKISDECFKAAPKTNWEDVEE